VKLLHVECPIVVCKQQLTNRSILSRIYVQYVTAYCAAAYFVFYKKASSCNVKYSTKDFHTRQNKNISTHKIYVIGSDNFLIILYCVMMAFYKSRNFCDTIDNKNQLIFIACYYFSTVREISWIIFPNYTVHH